jgi:hypothetical protein
MSTSDWPAARVHLERAIHYLRGDDKVSARMREAVELLLEANAAMEFQMPLAQVIPYRNPNVYED